MEGFAGLGESRSPPLKTAVYDAVQAVARRIPGMKREQVFADVKTKKRRRRSDQREMCWKVAAPGHLGGCDNRFSLDC